MADDASPPGAVRPGARLDPAPAGGFAVRQAGHLLRRAYAIARRNSAKALSALGEVSPVQASVLSALTEGALTQAELSRRIGMEPANTHTIVRRMVAAGLVETRRDPLSRRLVLVELTADGAAVAARLGDRIQAATDLTLAVLKPAERLALVEMLARIVLADEEHGPPMEGDGADMTS